MDKLYIIQFDKCKTECRCYIRVLIQGVYKLVVILECLAQKQESIYENRLFIFKNSHISVISSAINLLIIDTINVIFNKEECFLNLNFKKLWSHCLFKYRIRLKFEKVAEESQQKSKNLRFDYFSFNIGFAEWFEKFIQKVESSILNEFHREFILLLYLLSVYFRYWRIFLRNNQIFKSHQVVASDSGILRIPLKQFGPLLQALFTAAWWHLAYYMITHLNSQIEVDRQDFEEVEDLSSGLLLSVLE